MQTTHPQRATGESWELTKVVDFMTAKTQQANDFWDAMEVQLQPGEMAFLLWLTDWHFYSTFQHLTANQMQGNNPNKVSELLAIVGLRLRGKPKPSNDLLNSFAASRDVSRPIKTADFIKQNYFSFNA